MTKTYYTTCPRCLLAGGLTRNSGVCGLCLELEAQIQNREVSTPAARVVAAVNARTTHTHIYIVSGVLDHLASLGEVRLPTGDADEFWTEFWTTLEASSGRPIETCPECETNPQDPQRMSGTCDDCIRATEVDPARNDTPEVIIAELLAIAGGEPTGDRESIDLWKRAEAYLNRRATATC